MEIKNEKVIDFFDSLAENWDNKIIINAEKIEKILDYANIGEGQRILDLACGTGVLFNFLLEKKVKEIVGIDISPEMIKKAQLKFNHPNIKTFAMDFFDYNENNFDVVTIYSAYPHFQNREKLAKHVSECLKEGGRFIVAHIESKEKINSRHNGKIVSDVSTELKSAEEEALFWKPYFNVDTLIDNDEIYILSGVKK